MKCDNCGRPDPKHVVLVNNFPLCGACVRLLRHPPPSVDWEDALSRMLVSWDSIMVGKNAIIVYGIRGEIVLAWTFDLPPWYEERVNAMLERLELGEPSRSQYVR